MASKYHRVQRFTGVYYYESQDKKIRGKPDCCYMIRYQDQYNRQRWEKVGWKSEGYSAQFASNVRNERIQQARHGTLPENRRNVTFGDIWQRYDKWLESGRSRPYDDRQRYRDYLKRRLEHLPLDNISPLELEELKSQLLQSGLAPATVKHCLVIVRQVINKAIAWGLWQGENPVKKIKMPQLSNARERFLSREEARRLISELGKRSKQTQRLAIVSLETGLRAGELRSMRWQDIDWDSEIIYVRGKGGYDRQVYMTNEVMSALREQWQITSTYVFESRHGQKTQDTSRAFSRAVEACGLNNGVDDRRQIVSFHTLRHTFASWLALNGTPLLTIKELLGHKSLNMTMRYAHLCPDHKREAVRQVSGLWSSSGDDPKSPPDP